MGAQGADVSGHPLLVTLASVKILIVVALCQSLSHSFPLATMCVGSCIWPELFCVPRGSALYKHVALRLLHFKQCL